MCLGGGGPPAQWWVETLSQRGALQELRRWLADLEAGLEERQSSADPNASTAADLRLLLKYYQVTHSPNRRVSMGGLRQSWCPASCAKSPGVARK